MTLLPLRRCVTAVWSGGASSVDPDPEQAEAETGRGMERHIELVITEDDEEEEAGGGRGIEGNEMAGAETGNTSAATTRKSAEWAGETERDTRGDCVWVLETQRTAVEEVLMDNQGEERWGREKTSCCGYCISWLRWSCGLCGAVDWIAFGWRWDGWGEEGRGEETEETSLFRRRSL